jgi:hypothetical protein
MGLFSRKIKPSSVSGDVEMQTIRPHKRLGSRRLAPNQGIYRQRVKTSKRRKVKRTPCARKGACKFTHGPTRRYCRKRRNQRV